MTQSTLRIGSLITSKTMSNEKGPHTDWRPKTEQPESDRRIVALFNDGSGAELFWVHSDGTMIGQDGDECSTLGEMYDRWAYLPDGYRTWIEDNLD